MTTQANKAALQKAIAHFNDVSSREAYFDLYTADCILYMPDVPPGIEGVKGFYRGFWQGFPDAKLTVQELIGEGEMLACRYELEATHLGPFNGMPATGKKISFGGITLLHFENGCCTERWNQADFMALLQQLGALPAPAKA